MRRRYSAGMPEPATGGYASSVVLVADDNEVAQRLCRRVLEKAGYTLEARLRRSAVKAGVIVDQCQYAFIASGP